MAGPSGSTSALHLPYPTPDDTVDVPRDVKALADKLDAHLGGGGVGGGGVLNMAPVLDVGLAGQIRAGRQLTLADFTGRGLAAPAGLWNLSDLTDASGNGRNLTNKGAVPFGVGINGQVSTAAVFAGSTAQALYIADTGAADPFRIRTGSWGCWFRTAKRGIAQQLIGKTGASLAVSSWSASVSAANVLQPFASDGATQAALVPSMSDVCDDRWHHVTCTHDGTTLRTYVDGVLESTVSYSGALNATATAPLNIGAYGADGATAAGNSNYGRVDEAFVTADVLSEDQIRNLYCAKLAHGLGVAPSDVRLDVTRRKRGGPLAPTDFPTQPVRLHNFTGGALTDQGSGGVALGGSGTLFLVAGADGVKDGAYSYGGLGQLIATDAGLPAALASRSYGCWLKTTSTAAAIAVMAWGTSNTADALLWVASGIIRAASSADNAQGPFVADGQWHHVIVTEDNAAGDGVRRKLYVDGRLVAGSTVMNPITLAGANRFRVGAHSDGTLPFVGQIDGAFVCGYALTFEQIAALYAKGSLALPLSPKNAGDHVEGFDATNVYATFDSLDSTAQIDLGVAP
jgi:hypothetical protein